MLTLSGLNCGYNRNSRGKDSIGLVRGVLTEKKYGW